MELVKLFLEKYIFPSHKLNLSQLSKSPHALPTLCPVEELVDVEAVSLNLDLTICNCLVLSLTLTGRMSLAALVMEGTAAMTCPARLQWLVSLATTLSLPMTRLR